MVFWLEYMKESSMVDGVDWMVYYMVVSKAGETALLKAVLRAFYSVEGTVTLKGGSWVIEVVVSKV